MRNAFVLFGVLALYLIVVPGCASKKEKEIVVVSDNPSTKTTSNSTEHSHSVGPHGGLVAAVGLDDKIHVELVIDRKDKQSMSFYILGQDERTDLEIPSRLMEAVCINNDNFTHTSVVPGRLGETQMDNRFFGNLPNFEPTQVLFKLQISEARYTVKWDLMPKTGTATEEEEICLKPSGEYTLEDIKANGNVTPSQKFKGMVFSHEKAKDGDVLCPVTNVKIDNRCKWVVGGKTYYFCCPPCISAFIKEKKNDDGKNK